MRIATYHRVSTLDQNPTLARDELRAAAARMGELAMEVEEKRSGARNDRPGAQARSGGRPARELDAVLVWKLDRFGRSALDVLANIRALDAARVRFVVTTQGIDVRPGGDAMSRLILGVLASVAEFERDLLRERTRLGLAHARALGVRLGRRPGSTTARPEASSVAELRDRGMSWTQVARQLGCSTSSARRAAA